MNDIPVAVWALEAFFLVVHVWALVLALKRPAWAWAAAGKGKGLWVTLLIVSFFLPCLGWILVLWYLFSVDTAVRRQEQIGGRPGFPGGGSYPV
jgi:hypothetical protein